MGYMGKIDMEEAMQGELHEEIMIQSQPFIKLMNQYKSAIMEVETKLKILDAEFSMVYDRNPFESIKSRLKNPHSIIKKLKKKGQIEILLATVEFEGSKRYDSPLAEMEGSL